MAKKDPPRDPRGENEQAVKDGWKWLGKAINTPQGDGKRVDRNTARGRKPKNTRGKR